VPRGGCCDKRCGWPDTRQGRRGALLDLEDSRCIFEAPRIQFRARTRRIRRHWTDAAGRAAQVGEGRRTVEHPKATYDIFGRRPDIRARYVPERT